MARRSGSNGRWSRSTGAFRRRMPGRVSTQVIGLETRVFAFRRRRRAPRRNPRFRRRLRPFVRIRCGRGRTVRPGDGQSRTWRRATERGAFRAISAARPVVSGRVRHRGRAVDESHPLGLRCVVVSSGKEHFLRRRGAGEVEQPFGEIYIVGNSQPRGRYGEQSIIGSVTQVAGCRQARPPPKQYPRIIAIVGLGRLWISLNRRAPRSR